MRTVRQYGGLLRERGRPVRVRPGDRLAERSAEQAAVREAAAFLNRVREFDPDARWAGKPEVRFGPVDKFTGRTVGWVGFIESSWHQDPTGKFVKVLDPTYFAGSHNLGCPLIVECPSGGRAAHIGLGECDLCGECVCGGTAEEHVLAAADRAESMAAEAMFVKAAFEPAVTATLSRKPLLPPLSEEERSLNAAAARIERDWERRRRVALMRERLGSINVAEKVLLDLYDTIKADVPPTTCDCGLCASEATRIAYSDSCDG